MLSHRPDTYSRTVETFHVSDALLNVDRRLSFRANFFIISYALIIQPFYENTLVILVYSAKFIIPDLSRLMTLMIKYLKNRFPRLHVKPPFLDKTILFRLQVKYVSNAAPGSKKRLQPQSEPS